MFSGPRRVSALTKSASCDIINSRDKLASRAGYFFDPISIRSSRTSRKAGNCTNPMADVLSPTDSLQLEASTSAPPRPLCAVCNHRYSIYTCPGCSTRTCSLPCSTTHKSSTRCTGQRDKVAYVPMNKYGWGTMMDDYVFLEDVGRRVGDWGKEIVKGGFTMKGPNTRGGEGRGRGTRGRGRGRGGGNGGGNTKRDALKIQLEVRDIEMDLLPIGMERRRINQSSWDHRYAQPLRFKSLKLYLLFTETTPHP